MNTAIIVQARMGSSRLPGKVLLPIMGRPVLEYELERLCRAEAADVVIVATTTNAADQAIEDLAARLRIPCFRGSEFDVLSRYYFAANEHGAETVVRCNADCPLIDPEVVDRVITAYKVNSGTCDYASNILKPTFPTGMHTEAFSFEALEQAYLNAVDPLEREHVTPYIYRRPDTFSLHNVALDQDLSWHRWTLDLAEDMELIKRIYEALYPTNPSFGMGDVLDLLDRHADWPMINGHIQKRATV